MEPKQIDLYEFLVESELQQYYNSIKNELKISNASHLKYASDEDLKQIGLSRPEIRRLRKFYEKYYPHGYLSKIKRLLQNPKRDDIFVSSQMASSEPVKTASSPGKAPSNKHIIPADSICVNKQLGTGEFGIVQQGVWTNGAERIQVAIKCLCRERMQSNPMEFLKEAAIMHAIEHENIVRLYGVVLDTDSLMLVTELAHLRSLLECLKDSGLRVSFLTVPTLCEFAMQICNGMMYLENKRLIHRDLAARNILVFSKNKVKISDFGLSRALGVGKDYYKTNFNVNLKLPIAWCAPECINYLRFTNASDVWAYGVCLWEMFSYGFQPWAALTGIQILEAIDEPNYQRLEQPECCPREYYTLMLKCWQHDPSKRPKFSDIYTLLPEMKPEQLKTIVSNCEPKKDHLMYRQGEIVTVLDKATNSPYWKGVLNSGKTGLFNPANTVAYVEGLPLTANRESFCRTADRSSKRKLRTEMISMPQNDLKHTGHVGLDGAYFGDVAFMANSQNYNPPRQIVTPYKPSEDIEQTPLLLPPTPTSPDSLQTASGYFPETIATSSTNPSFVNSNENTPKHQTNAFGSSFDFPPQTIFNSSNPFASNSTDPQQSEDDSLPDSSQKNTKWSESDTEPQHEYHEISDDEITAEKVFDLGPSLLDEINSMFGSISTTVDPAPKSPDFEHTNKKNEITELTSKLNRKNSADGSSKSKKKSTGIVKQISVKDEKILNQAIEIANEISARSMTDLVSDTPTSAQSPKRKFSFRFPNLSHHNSTEKDNTTPSSGHFNGHTNTLSHSKERKNFSEELKNIPDLQRFRSLTEIEKYDADIKIPLFDKESADFCFEKSRELLSRPFNIELPAKEYDSQTMSLPPQSQPDRSITPLSGSSALGLGNAKHLDKKTRDFIGENLLDIENTLKALNLDFLQTYNELDKTDSAETLFGEQFSHPLTLESISSSSGSSKARNSSNLNLYKTFEYGYSKLDMAMSNKNSSPLDKHGFSSSQIYTDLMDKLDDKRSSTPDTGFASRETNLSSSRRSSQKSNYSPQETHFSPKDITFANAIESRCYMNLRNEQSNQTSVAKNVNSSSPIKNVNASNNSIHLLMQNVALSNEYASRQRSMSFTDNYELKSPVLSEPQHRMNRIPNYCHRSPNSFRNKPRNVIAYKPRSIKARTLRRLSYNPIVLDSSSSTSSDSDFDHSIAHSECDIRTKMIVSSRKRRQYLNRKSIVRSDEVVQDKLYGSNTSIKSAPHYNYANERQRYAVQHYTSASYEQPDFDDKIYDFGGRGPGNNYGANNVIKPPRAFAANGASYEREILYSEFDVTKLTGKSPTTQNFFKDQLRDGSKQQQPPQRMLSNQGKIQQTSSSNFQWPDKIPASTIKQNELWRQQQVNSAQSALYSSLKVKQAFSTDSSSSDTDEIEFRRDFNPRVPPSPAP